MCTSTFSASRSKFTEGEPLSDLKSETAETWQKLDGHAIVAGERLQEKINVSVTCRFCQGSVEVVENLRSKNELRSTWMFQYQNEGCPSHQTNLQRNLAFPTKEKSRAFAINRVSVLGSRGYRWRSRGSLKGFEFSRSIAERKFLIN